MQLREEKNAKDIRGKYYKSFGLLFISLIRCVNHSDYFHFLSTITREIVYAF